MIVRYAALTDLGRVRDHNEDAIGEPRAFAMHVSSRGWLFAVADGMGGHADGAVASQTAIRTLFDSYYGSDAQPQDAIVSAALAANVAVREAGTAALQRSGTADESRRMGTTLVACAIAAEHLFGVSVGDSREYLFRDGVLTPLTQDETLAAEQERRGHLTPDQARHSQFRSVLLQALGHTALLRPQRFEAALQPRDIVLLCSDGLHGVVDDAAITKELASGSVDGAAHALINMANANGGPDNISVVVIACG